MRAANTKAQNTSSNSEPELQIDFGDGEDFELEIKSKKMEEEISKTVKYVDCFARPNNFIPFEIAWENIDKHDFIKEPFNEILISPKYVHLYFDFDEIATEDEFYKVMDFLASLAKYFGDYSWGGYTNDKNLSEEVGFRYIPGDKHFLSMHVVYYKTKILSSDLVQIMKHTEKKGFLMSGVHEKCDPNVYKLLPKKDAKTSRQLIRHVLSNKIYSPGDSKNRDNHGNLIEGTPSQHIIQVHGDEPTITREIWQNIFKTKEEVKAEQKIIKDSTEVPTITRNVGDNFDVDISLIILDEDQLYDLICNFEPEYDNLQNIVLPILYHSPYELDFLEDLLERWYMRREHTNSCPVSNFKSYYEHENTNKYFFSLLNHLDDNVRKEYLRKYQKNRVDDSVEFEMNTNFSIKNIREKNYKCKTGFGVKVGEFLSDLKRVFVFVDRGNPTFIIKMYDSLHKSFSLEYMTYKTTKDFLKSIKLGKCMKSYNEKTITAWDIYDAGNNKNIFRKDDMSFYSPEQNIFSYFSGYNYNKDGEINMNIIQPFLDHVLNVICNNNSELYEYILSWFSYIIQVPNGKTGVAIVITGRQGTGKNFFSDILCDLLGVYANRNVNNIENIVGKFNTSLENKKLIVCNELASADANKYLDSDRLKSVLTEDRVELNQKCVAVRSIENVANLIIISNNKIPVKIESGDRRYVVTDTSSSKIGDHAYFDELFNMKTKEFYENLFKFFAQKDVSSWNRRKLPQTEAKDDIIEASESSYLNFISNYKSEFMKEPGYHTTQAYLDYQPWCKKFGYTCCSQKKFGSEMKKYCSKPKKTIGGKQIYYYKLLPEYVEKIEEVINDENVVDFENSI